MPGLEEGHVTPARYIRKVAREAIGLDAAQRRYHRELKTQTNGKKGMLILSIMSGMQQVSFPMTSAKLLSDPHRELSDLEKIGFYQLALITIAFDIGTDAISIIMAVTGNIDAAIVTKLGQNVVTPVIADIIRPSLSAVYFERKKGLNSL